MVKPTNGGFFKATHQIDATKINDLALCLVRPVADETPKRYALIQIEKDLAILNTAFSHCTVIAIVNAFPGISPLGKLVFHEITERRDASSGK